MDPTFAAEVFLWKEQRTVDKAGVISVLGNRYEVDPRLYRQRRRRGHADRGSGASKACRRPLPARSCGWLSQAGPYSSMCTAMGTSLCSDIVTGSRPGLRNM